MSSKFGSSDFGELHIKTALGIPKQRYSEIQSCKQSNTNKMKRDIFSTISSKYDLMGFTAPVICTNQVIDSRVMKKVPRLDTKSFDDLLRQWNT